MGARVSIQTATGVSLSNSSNVMEINIHKGFHYGEIVYNYSNVIKIHKGFHYGESGVSHNRCMETYCGPEAFSEVEIRKKNGKKYSTISMFSIEKVEMRNIRDFVMTLDPVPVLGHCFHSYSQLWLWPYGYAFNVSTHLA